MNCIYARFVRKGNAWLYLTFPSAEEQQKALNALKRYHWKGRTLVSMVSSSSPISRYFSISTERPYHHIARYIRCIETKNGRFGRRSGELRFEKTKNRYTNFGTSAHVDNSLLQSFVRRTSKHFWTFFPLLNSPPKI